jgi:hypothetical protein
MGVGRRETGGWRRKRRRGMEGMAWGQMGKRAT